MPDDDDDDRIEMPHRSFVPSVKAQHRARQQQELQKTEATWKAVLAGDADALEAWWRECLAAGATEEELRHKLDEVGGEGASLLHFALLCYKPRPSGTVAGGLFGIEGDGHVRVVRWLLEHRRGLLLSLFSGADCAYLGENALHMAIAKNDIRLVMWIMETACSSQAERQALLAGRAVGEFFVKGGSAYYGEMPLSFAVCMNQVDVVRYLVERFPSLVNLSLGDSHGNTPGHMAAFYGLHGMYRILDAVWSGGVGRPDEWASVPLGCIVNREGCAPMVLAAKMRHVDMFEQMWEKDEARTHWKWGNITCKLYPLELVDYTPRTTHLALFRSGNDSGGTKAATPLTDEDEGGGEEEEAGGFQVTFGGEGSASGLSASLLRNAAPTPGPDRAAEGLFSLNNAADGIVVAAAQAPTSLKGMGPSRQSDSSKESLLAGGALPASLGKESQTLRINEPPSMDSVGARSPRRRKLLVSSASLPSPASSAAASSAPALATHAKTVMDIVCEDSNEAIITSRHVLRLLDNKWFLFGRKLYLLAIALDVAFLCLFMSMTITRSEMPEERIAFHCPDATSAATCRTAIALEVVILLVTLARFGRFVFLALLDKKAFAKDKGTTGIKLWLGVARDVFILGAFLAEGTVDQLTSRFFWAPAAVLSWSQSIFYLLAFESTGTFVVILAEMVTGDIIPIVFIILLVYAGFVQCFLALSNAPAGDFGGATGLDLFSYLLTTLLRWVISPDFIDGSDAVYLPWTFLFHFVVTVVIFSLLIALLNETFISIMTHSKGRWNLERARIMYNMEEALPESVILWEAFRYWSDIEGHPYLMDEDADMSQYKSERNKHLAKRALAEIKSKRKVHSSFAS